MTKKLIQRGFLMAGLSNILGVAIFSRLFTNEVIPATDPVVMSNFGLLMIMVWGLAYIAVAKPYQHMKWLVGVFFIEKFVYGFVWAKWLSNNSLAAVYDQDTMAGIFYTIYGINDWLFFLFFGFVFIRLLSSNKS